MAVQIPVPPMDIPADEYDSGGNPFDLSGRHALVTGATGPLGRALAVGLAEAGADVSLTTLGDDATEELAARSISAAVTALGRRSAVRRVDLTDPTAVAAAVAGIESDVAPLDILVNAQHGANIKSVLKASLADWQRELDRNATSVFVATQAVGKGMVERGYGRIITLVSILHDRGVPNAAIYGASQGAVLGFTKSLGLEWGRNGVTVNALGLGFYDDIPGIQSDEEIHAILEKYIPLRRLGKPEDLQGAVVYLSSELAAFVDSESFVIDGAIQVHA
ncbi:MAG: SDR family oxidoreductase [Chloroflexi bacterium]|nr:SDR family oxidoreductase [Chloroflexota bacterium]